MTSAELAANEMEPAVHAAEVDPRAAAITSKLCWGIFLQTLAIGLVCVSSVGLHFEGMDRMVMAFAAISSLANLGGILLSIPGPSFRIRGGLSAFALVGSLLLFCYGTYVETKSLPYPMVYVFISLILQAAIAALLGGCARVLRSLSQREPAESRSHFSLLSLMLIISGVALLLGGTRQILVRMGWTSFETVTHGTSLYMILCGGGAIAGFIPQLATYWRSRTKRWGIVITGVAVMLGLGVFCQLGLEWVTSGRANTTMFDWAFCLVIQLTLTTIGLGPLLFGGESTAPSRKYQNRRYVIAIGLPMIAALLVWLLIDHSQAADYDYFPLVESLFLATISLLAIVITMDNRDNSVRVPICVVLTILYASGVAFALASYSYYERALPWMMMFVLQVVLIAASHHFVRAFVRNEPTSELRFWTRLVGGVIGVGLLGLSVAVATDFWSSIWPRIALLATVAAILPMIALDAPDPHWRKLALFATIPAAMLLTTFSNSIYELPTGLLFEGEDAARKMIAAAVIGQTVVLTIAILPLIWAPERVESNDESADAVGEITAEN